MGFDDTDLGAAMRESAARDEIAKLKRQLEELHALVRDLKRETPPAPPKGDA